MPKKQTARKRLMRFPSVAPVTSRETTGATLRQPNLRAVMKQRVAILMHRIERDGEEVKRLNKAIVALGTKR